VSTRSPWVLTSLLLGLVLTPAAAHANANGTVFSGPTDGDGASLYFNPAALDLISGTQLYLSAAAVVVGAGYQRLGPDPTYGNPSFAPVSLVALKPEVIPAVVTSALHPRLRLALGLTAPIVSGAGWPETVQYGGKTILGPTRYYAASAQLINFFIHAQASFRFNRYLAVGAGPHLVVTTFFLQQDVDLGNQAAIRQALAFGGTPPKACSVIACELALGSAPARIQGTGVGVGGVAGVLFTPLERLRIGATYVSPSKVGVPTTVRIDSGKLDSFVRQYLPSFTTLGLNASGTTDMVVPQQVHAAVAFDVVPAWEVMAALTWINSSVTSAIDVNLTQRGSTLLPAHKVSSFPHDDQFIYVARVQYRHQQRWRLGFRIDYSPPTVPEIWATPSNVDFHRLELSLGGEIRLGGRHVLGATFSHFVLLPRTIMTSAYANDRPDPYNKPDPAGRYTAFAERLGLNYSVTF
jgi:long-subunit fatty acid transport protein